MLEYLLTLHSCRRQIAALPDDQIARLRELLKQAVAKNIDKEAVYNALAVGFQKLEQQASPPLAFDGSSENLRLEALFAALNESR